MYLRESIPGCGQFKLSGSNRPLGWLRFALPILLLAACSSAKSRPALDSGEPPADTPHAPAAGLPTAGAPGVSPSPIATVQAISGELVFSDDFSIDRGWQLSDTSKGVVSLFDETLVIAVRQPGAMLFALGPRLDPGDTYFVSVSMRTELCRDGDEFGLMLFVSPGGDHLRFTLNCQGAAKVSRFRAGTDAALVPSVETFSARPGAPAVNQIGVLVGDREMRYFINQLEVFQTHRYETRDAGFGLLAWSRSGSQITVTFDDFELSAGVAPLDPSPMASEPQS